MKAIFKLGFFFLSLTLLAFFSQHVLAEIAINGAGATFPYPVYAQWGYAYNLSTGVKLNYQSIGSGGGIAQIKAKTVDFGASDAPLKPEELEEAGLMQFPMIMGGVVPVINLEGIAVGSLKLTPETLSKIFLGEITKWNDASLAKDNPDLKLPEKDITVVHRADGSGTTWIFTNYLDKISPTWHSKVGTSNAVSWPLGVGGKGNEGVAAYVQRVAGSIGYVEYAYAMQNKMNTTQLQNVAGKFLSPSMESFQAAASSADWKNASNYYVVLTNQAGDASWPITGASFILIYKNQMDATKAKELIKFFDWSYKNGGAAAQKLHYVPMPQDVVALVEESWKSDLTSQQASVWP
jgi:phosphate transport system substrate-binding protein